MMILSDDTLTIRDTSNGNQIAMHVMVFYALSEGLRLADALESGEIDPDIEAPIRDIVSIPKDSVSEKLRDLFRGINGTDKAN